MATEPIYQIEKIEIVGLNKTKNYIIKREIKFLKCIIQMNIELNLN